MEPALETRGLAKRFGPNLALDSVSMTVPRRAIYGFVGANGAGKTTTIKLILGLLRADAGTIRLFGADVAGRGAREIGALVESPALYDHLTGVENLDLTRRLLGAARAEIGRVLAIVDLEHAADRRVGGYSFGMRQRLGIARALIGSPRLLILDEPTNGLDPDGICAMRALLRQLPETGDVTLIVSSHLLVEIEQIASHVGVLHRGRLLVEAPLAELLGAPGAAEVVTDDPSQSAALLAGAGFLIDAGTDRLIVEAAGGAAVDPADIAALLVAHGHRLTHLATRARSLEAIYHRYVRRGLP